MESRVPNAYIRLHHKKLGLDLIYSYVVSATLATTLF